MLMRRIAAGVRSSKFAWLLSTGVSPVRVKPVVPVPSCAAAVSPGIGSATGCYSAAVSARRRSYRHRPRPPCAVRGRVDRARRQVHVTPLRPARGHRRRPDPPSTTTRPGPTAPRRSRASTELGVAIDARRPRPCRSHGRGLGGSAFARDRVARRRQLGLDHADAAGILAAHPFATTLDGDASLRRRPMRRIIDSARPRWARRVRARPTAGCRSRSRRADLHAIDFATRVASAQVKSAVLLAGLHAEGDDPCRRARADERSYGARAARVRRAAVIDGLPRDASRAASALRPQPVRVPGDPSSAAFWAVAAAGLPGSEVELERRAA